MIDTSNALVYKLRFVFMGALIAACFVLLSFLISTIETNTAQAKSSDTPDDGVTMEMTDSPNVVANGMNAAGDEFGQTVSSTAFAINDSVKSVATITTQGSKRIARSTQLGIATAARGVGNGLAFTGRKVGGGLAATGRGIGKGFSFAFGVPRAAIKVVSRTAVVSAIIRPSDHVEVPVIDPNSPELKAAVAALPPTPTASPGAPQQTAGPQWPIHGAITTEFGVAHWPYQPTHTGLDISDGQRSGATPIKPFRPGKVVETVASRAGLGNHVVVDHGNGVTSVYGHLYAISVKVGQEVGLDTTIGLEGSTGVSTGTHLHFEIRVNGQAANPHQFISGHP